MKERPLDVQARAAWPFEQGGRGKIDRDSGTGEDEHEPAVHVCRRDQPAYGLVHDPDPDERERDPVRERREDLHAPEAERPAPAGGTSGHRGRDEREPKRGRVSEHVPRVGEQGERAGDDPDRDLGNQQAGDERERSGQQPPVA